MHFEVTPSEGHDVRAETGFAPVELTCNRLIERTGALGLHFEGHAAMQGNDLPEWSQSSGSEADRFTADFHEWVKCELAARRAKEEEP